MNAPVKIDAGPKARKGDEAAAAPQSMILVRKIRLNPERRQHRALERITEQQRQLWNGMLEDFIESRRRKLGSSQQIEWGTYTRRDGSTGEGYVVRRRVSDYLEDVPAPDEGAHSKALTIIRSDDPAFSSVQRRAQRESIARFWLSVKAFYKRAKAGAGSRSGYPRFKSRDDIDGFGFDAFQQIRFDGRGLWFDGMPGKLRLQIDRALPPTLLFTIRKGKTADFAPGDAFSIVVTEAGDGTRTVSALPDAGNAGDGVLVLAAQHCRGPVAPGVWRLVCRAKKPPKADETGGEARTDEKAKIVFDLFTPAGVLLDHASVGMAYDNIKSVWFVRRDEWSPRTKRVMQVWHCGFSIRVPIKTDRRGKGSGSVGVDWGTSVLAALSTGEMIANPRFKEKRERDIKRLQRAVNRKQKGSKGRRIARAMLNHVTGQVAAERKRYMNKLSKRLVTHYKTVVTEDFDVTELMNAERPGEQAPKDVKQRRNREALDAAPFMLRQMIDYKARLYGARRIGVQPGRFKESDGSTRVVAPSAYCLWCGGFHFKELTDAEHVCTAQGRPSYGRREPRKVHAAKVIEHIGLNGIPAPVGGSRGGLVPGGAKRRSGAACLGNTESGQPLPGQRQGNPGPTSLARK